MTSRNQTLLFVLLVVVLLVFAPKAYVAGTTEYNLQPPTGIPIDVWTYFVPRDNPLTTAKVELGRKLFFDPRLSANGSVSCSTCHDPRFGFADNRKVAIGIDSRRGTRNTPTVLNAMFNSTLFWDGRVESLEAQALEPLVHPDEMGNSSREAVGRRLAAMPDYVDEFSRAFGRSVDSESIAKAIAAYERTLVSANSPYDRYLAGDRAALSQGALRG